MIKDNDSIYSRVTVDELINYFNVQSAKARKFGIHSAEQHYANKAIELQHSLKEYIAEYIAHTDAQLPHSNS